MSTKLSERVQTRRVGVLFAGATAVISGIAVFINGYGVRAWSDISDPATYTTLKNGTAALILLAATALAVRRGSMRIPDRSQLSRHRWGLATVAVVGGALPFLLFFEGLSRASSADGAFLHKTLVIWVALLAVVFLKERMGAIHVAAIAVLIGGQAAISGFSGIEPGTGELMILAATLLWSVETVVAKRVLAEVPPLAVGLARMGGGSLVLLAYVLAFGDLPAASQVTATHLGWIAFTGLTLAGYVASWFAALARAQAVDVTAVLVGGALITATLEVGIRGTALPSFPGLALVFVGVVLVAIYAWARPAPDR